MEAPTFRKPDKYKLGSYRTYNFNAPRSYDSSLALRLFQASLWDRVIVSKLATGIESLRILDVGCATGRLLLSLAQGGARHLHGVDLAPRILEIARDKLHRQELDADLRASDVEEKIPWPNESFDVVTLTGVLHHFYRPADAFGEVWRVLAARGRLLIVDPRFAAPLRQLVNLYLRFLPHEGDYRFYTPLQVVDMITTHGWSDVGYRKVGWASFLVCARKPVES